MKKILLSLAAFCAVTGLMAQGQSVIYSENFDNGVPSTWTQTTNATDGGFLGGNTYTHYANSTISVNQSPAQGSFDFWVGTSNMDVIVWLQDNTSGEVLQSGFGKYSTSGVDEMDDVAKFIAVYPNPADDIAGVELDLIDRSDVTLNLVNSLGQTVYTSAKTLDAGVQKIEVPTSILSAGLYFVNVNVNGISKTLR
ncbi:T9SS type A sorting domain-containing protein [Schleiferiaceae bacterium]|nr:T9SS type A sorting domain-containing protein [Schleiferiaceae bacterium]